MSSTNPVILVMGLLASGKSSITKVYTDLKMVNGTPYRVLNRDAIGGSILGLVPIFELALSKGENIVLDNTFLTAESRAPFIAAAKAAGRAIECHWMQTSFADCQVNALHRMWDRYGQVFLTADDIKAHPEAKRDSNIFPLLAMFAAKKKLNGVKKKGVWLVPSGKPTKDEGFSRIVKVPFERRPWGVPSKATQAALGIPEGFITGDTSYSTSEVVAGVAPRKAIILDYDGTLRRDAREVGGPHPYPIKPSEVELLPNVADVLKAKQAEGYLLLGVTTQSGIGKGHMTETEAVGCIMETNRLIGQAMGVNGFTIHAVYCPHYNFPVQCYCRKPQPGLGVHLVRTYDLDPAECIFVGDQTSDKTFAERCGFKFAWADDFFGS